MDEILQSTSSGLDNLGPCLKTDPSVTTHPADIFVDASPDLKAQIVRSISTNVLWQLPQCPLPSEALQWVLASSAPASTESTTTLAPASPATKETNANLRLTNVCDTNRVAMGPAVWTKLPIIPVSVHQITAGRTAL